MTTQQRVDAARRFAVLSVVAILFLWFFGTALFTGRSFAFRDAAHYYHPLFQWTSDEWSSGRIPLWNPNENLGVPVLADTTSSVFYPGKLLFCLPFSYVLRYKLYVSLHVLLAASGAYLLARSFRVSIAGAGLAAIAYAFGGHVLFQHCNVVFLVGAGWLPYAIWFADRGLQRRSLWSTAGFGAVLALMTLGGDPQTAYHCGLLSTGYAWLLWRRDQRHLKFQRKRFDESQVCAATSNHSRLRRLFHHRLVLLAIAASVGFVLAAVQILPAARWSASSNRASFAEPRNIYEIEPAVRQQEQLGRETSYAGAAKSLFRPPIAGTHHEHIYHFSVGPWRLPEFIWPNVSGKMFPVNQRWINAIPGEGRVWTPSFYMGLLPLVLGLAGLRFRSGNARWRWISWMVILGIFASLGWYGIGWLMLEIRHAFFHADLNDIAIGQPVGGLYWFFVTFLPAYAYFRFPAKWLVVAALGLSLLAGHGLDRLGRRRWKTPLRLAAILAIVSFVLLVVTFSLADYWRDWLSSAPVDTVFGPIRAAAALSDLRQALFHGMVVAILSLGLIKVQRRRSLCTRRLAGLAIFGITAIELAIANAWLTPLAAQTTWNGTPDLAIAIHEHSLRKPQTPRFFRTTTDWVPSDWRSTSSNRRLQQSLQWDRQTLFPKHHLADDLSLVNSYSTMVPADLDAFMRSARLSENRRSNKTHALDLTGAEFIAGRRGSRPHLVEIEFDGREPWDLGLWRNPAAFPRAWIVHDVVRLAETRSLHPKAIQQRTDEVLTMAGKARDFRRQAVVETNDSAVVFESAPDGQSGIDPSDNDRCRIVSKDPQHISIDATLKTPGLLVLADYYYPAWEAELVAENGQRNKVPILRTNRILRGVWLPAGRHRLEMAYRPRLFRAGGIISLLGWACMIITGLARLYRQKTDARV